MSVRSIVILLMMAWVASIATAQPCEPDFTPGLFPVPASISLGGTVTSYAYFDDGSGPALYLGGAFSTINGVSTRSIARWDGHTMSEVGGGLDRLTGGLPFVRAMRVFDDGDGPALYVIGDFSHAGGQPINHIAKWDGTAWTGLGVGENEKDILTLEAHDDGDGPALYVGGRFVTMGGVPARRVARWDGQAWSALGQGFGPSTSGGYAVHALKSFHDGQSERLVAAGDFNETGMPGIAIWDEQAWSGLGGGINSPHYLVNGIYSLATVGQGKSQRLLIGGEFTSVAGIPALRIAQWDGKAWSAIGEGFPSTVRSIAVRQAGDEATIFAAGSLDGNTVLPRARIAKWTGTHWERIGGVSKDRVNAIWIHPEEPEDELYIGGPSGDLFDRLLPGFGRWTPDGWRLLGSGLSSAVNALLVSNSAQPELLVAGHFTAVDQINAQGIAVWDGTAWKPFAAGHGFNRPVRTLAYHDDGTGPALFAAGEFFQASGSLANRIARWSGEQWEPLGSGLTSSASSIVSFDDGSGPALYAAGNFTQAGGQPVNFVARWDGKSWSALDQGMNRSVKEIIVFDDGSGPALYAGGTFSRAAGKVARGIARWDGQTWTEVAGGFSQGISENIGPQTLVVHDDGNGPALYAGGMLGPFGYPHVVKLEGSQWIGLGNGLTGFGPNKLASVQINGSRHLVASSETIYGPGRTVVFWDGQAWLPLGSPLNNAANDFAVLPEPAGESLYIGGYFTHAGDTESWYMARWGCPPADCAADLNADGVLNFFDMAAFIAAFQSQDPAGDFNNDGVFNFFDFSAFIHAFNSGCS